MNWHRFRIKASTLCVGGTFLVLGGFVSANLAGCGGGGGGNSIGGSGTGSTTGISFQLLLEDGTKANSGSVTLTRLSSATKSAKATGSTYTASANASGVVAFTQSIPKGTYSVQFTVRDANKTNVTTVRTLIIDTSNQTFTLVEGDNGTGSSTGGFLITGKVVANPEGINDPDGDSTTANCTTTSLPITARLVIAVRDLDTTKGRPIIAQVTRDAQSTSATGIIRGGYAITVPYRPQTFRVEVSDVPADGAPFAGYSALTTFPSSVSSLDRVDVCTNQSDTPPNPGVTPTPILTPTPFPTPTGTLAAPTATTPSQTATPQPTTVVNTPTPRPTATPQPTNTPIATSTPFGGATPTSTPQPTNTPQGT